MSPTTQGLIVIVATLLLLFSGVPVAFGLGAVSIVFLLIFQGLDAMQVVAEANTVAEGVSACERLQPNVVLLDIQLPDGSGFEACRQILPERRLHGVETIPSFEQRLPGCIEV